MKLNAAELAIANLRTMEMDILVTYAREGIKLATGAKNATNENRSSAPAMGKVLCVMAERLEQQKQAKNAPSAKSLKEYFAECTKGGKIQNHWYQCKDAFAAYVQSALITEKDFDSCSANALELAGQIYAQVAKAGGDLSHKAVRETATVLAERVDGYVGLLRSILNSVKPVTKMSAEDATAALAQIIMDGHLVLVLNTAGAEFANLPNAETAKPVFLAANVAMEMFSANKNLTEQDFGVWLDEHESAKKPAPQNPAEPLPKAA